MRAKRFQFSAVAAIAIALCAPSAEASDPASLTRGALKIDMRLHVREGRMSPPPFAYTRFCVQNPDDCRAGGSATVDWKATMSLVRTTNLRINRKMHPVNDAGDRWMAGAATGDCEDFALTKRRELIRQGLPGSALRMATATTSSGEGHAVLVVRTDAGDYVLDNRTGRILKWHQTDLKWLKIASAHNPRVWHIAN